MRTTGHHHEVPLVGDVRTIDRDRSGAAIGVIQMVDVDEPYGVPIMFPTAWSGVSVADRLWVTPLADGVVVAPGGPLGEHCAPPRQVWPPARARSHISQGRLRGPVAAPR